MDKLIGKYHVTRHYGGPEEGGWWFDMYEFKSSFPYPPIIDTEECLYGFVYQLNSEAKAAQSNPQGRFSVENGTDVRFLIEDTPGEHQSTTRPHYE